MNDAASLFDVEPAASNSSINELVALGENLIALEAQISEIEKLLKTLNGRATELKTKEIPDKMAEVGLSEFATPSGNKIKVEDFISAAFPKGHDERERTAIKRIHALEKMEGGSDIIKTEINVRRYR